MLAAHEDVEVWVSSSWRHHLNVSELGDLLQDIEPWFAGAVVHGARDEAIRDFISTYDISDFVILDDVVKFFRGDWSQLIVCNPALGISDPHVQRQLTRWLD